MIQDLVSDPLTILSRILTLRGRLDAPWSAPFQERLRNYEMVIGKTDLADAVRERQLTIEGKIGGQAKGTHSAGDGVTQHDTFQKVKTSGKYCKCLRDNIIQVARTVALEVACRVESRVESRVRSPFLNQTKTDFQ